MRSEDLSRALKAVLVTTTLASSFGLVIGLIYNDVPATVVGTSALIAIPPIWWLVARGRPTVAAIGLLSVFNALTVYALIFGGGVQDPTAMLFPGMIIASGILLDGRLATGASVVLVLSCIGVGVAEVTGLVDTRLSHLLSTSDVIFLAMLLVVVASLVLVLQRALRDSVQRAFVTHQSYQQIFNATGEGIVVHEADRGEVVDVNESALAMFGLPVDGRGEFGLETLIGATAANDRATLLRRLDAARHDSVRFEWCVRHRDGHPVWVDVTARAATVQGHDRIVSVLRDTTERRALQEQVHQAEKLRAVGQLARGVAHDFNNQLTVILANASLLETGVARDPQLAEYAQAIIESSRRSADLTQQLLAFARKGQRQYEPLDVDALVADVEVLLARSIDKRIEVEHVRSSAPAIIRGDANFLQNALLNLGLNARDAMPEGGRLRLVVEAAAARGSIARSADTVTIRVEDTGCGMSPEVKAHIFEPFYTTKHEGNGMGLAAVYGTVVAHDGSIDVDSTPGAGTTFTIRFPACADPTPTARVERGATASSRFAGLRVLLAEDEPAVARVTTRILAGLGCEVTHVADGRSALDALSNGVPAYDLAILDHSMPRMTGSEVLQVVRDRGSRLPIIAVSGYTEASEASVEHPPDAFVQKPFNTRSLSEALDAVLRAHRG